MVCSFHSSRLPLSSSRRVRHPPRYSIHSLRVGLAFSRRSEPENGMSSHGLLLRLFLSQGFFSVLHALQYIRTYSDNIGITHYLCSRLDAVATEELADKWPLVWCVDASVFWIPLLIFTGSHLLVTTPSSKSSALESFVLAKAKQSTHLALLVRSSTSVI